MVAVEQNVKRAGSSRAPGPLTSTVEESAKGLLQRFAALGPTTSGVFETYQGEEMPF